MELYDTDDRSEMLAFVPAVPRILDVGCSTGRFAALLRTRGPSAEIWGIDPRPHPAGRPSPFDHRIVGSFPEDVPTGEQFSCVVFNDVLEHMTDPWSALRATHAMLAAGGTVVASIPNIRHVVHVLRPLVIGGRWDYRKDGTLDRTHLRFFTRATIAELFADTGYTVAHLDPINVHTEGRWASLNRLVRGSLDDFLALEFAVVAHPTVPAPGSS